MLHMLLAVAWCPVWPLLAAVAGPASRERVEGQLLARDKSEIEGSVRLLAGLPCTWLGLPTMTALCCCSLLACGPWNAGGFMLLLLYRPSPDVLWALVPLPPVLTLHPSLKLLLPAVVVVVMAVAAAAVLCARGMKPAKIRTIPAAVVPSLLLPLLLPPLLLPTRSSSHQL